MLISILGAFSSFVCGWISHLGITDLIQLTIVTFAGFFVFLAATIWLCDRFKIRGQKMIAGGIIFLVVSFLFALVGGFLIYTGNKDKPQATPQPQTEKQRPSAQAGSAGSSTAPTINPAESEPLKKLTDEMEAVKLKNQELERRVMALEAKKRQELMSEYHSGYKVFGITKGNTIIGSSSPELTPFIRWGTMSVRSLDDKIVITLPDVVRGGLTFAKNTLTVPKVVGPISRFAALNDLVFYAQIIKIEGDFIIAVLGIKTS